MLEPLLFSIFNNDIFYLNFDCNTCSLADDTALYACNKSIGIVITDVESTFTSTLPVAELGGKAPPVGSSRQILSKNSEVTGQIHTIFLLENHFLLEHQCSYIPSLMKNTCYRQIFRSIC